MTEFAWSEPRNGANRKKHGISFETASAYLKIPPQFPTWNASKVASGDGTIGLTDGIVIVLVAHTVTEENGNEIIRIISARKANRRERDLYQTAH